MAEPAAPALSRGAVDRAAHRRTDPEWLSAAWRERGRVLRCHFDAAGLAVEVAPGPVLRLARSSGEQPPADAVFLGTDGGEGALAYWALEVPDLEPPAATLREVGDALSDAEVGLLVHAVAVLTWHRTHTHCPRCGAPTEPRQAGAVRVCTADGSEHFPRTDPAMIVLVTSPAGDQAVLGRAPSWPEGFYSCLAGFVEPGEAAEQAVVREVAEEVGLAVREVAYVASQPWPFPSSLMLAFRAVADVAPLQVDPSELADGRWFGRDELRAAVGRGEVRLPPRVSVARHLVDDWLGR